MIRRTQQATGMASDSTVGIDGVADVHAVAPEEAVAEAELASAPDDRPVVPSPEWRARLVTMLAVSAGGLLGANARYMVSMWAATRWGELFPWGTLIVNLAGSFVLGFYLTLVTERFTGRSSTRLFLATGFLGSFTTFSTFSYEVVTMAQRGDFAPAMAYVGLSLGAGLVAVVAGIAAAHAL